MAQFREESMTSMRARVFANCTFVFVLCAALIGGFGQAPVALAETEQEMDRRFEKIDPKMQPIALSMLLKSLAKDNITKSNRVYARALRKLERIARTSKDNNTVMLAVSALALYDPGNRIGAAKLDELARSGHAEAQYFLGILYRDGAGGRPKDLKRSHAWMLEAGKRGHGRGAFEAGQNYYFGRAGQPKNSREGFKWFLKSAEGGHPPAQFNVAMIYFDGKLVKQDMDKFLYWMQKAAKGGHAKAKQVVEVARKNGLLK